MEAIADIESRMEEIDDSEIADSEINHEEL